VNQFVAPIIPNQGEVSNYGVSDARSGVSASSAGVSASRCPFADNRSITFRHAQAPLTSSFLRYWLVAAAGAAVNYAAYLVLVALAPVVGLPVTPAILPLFVAAGSGAAMTLTFVGFRFFAFRP
jgi:putative flippase GtrA